MAKRNIPVVSLKVDKTYFDRIFEPGRRNLGIKLGRNFTQRAYTEYLAKKKFSNRNRI